MKRIISHKAFVACAIVMAFSLAVVSALDFGSTTKTSTATPKSITFAGYSWHLYHGVGGLGQRWDPTHVSVANGILTIKLTNGVGGGVSLTKNNQTYGNFNVRYRMSKGSGKYVLILWPGTGTRPEIDFSEDKLTDTNRVLTTGTYHPQPGCTNCEHFKTTGDFSTWHTLGVNWRSTGLRFVNDGVVWAHTASTSHIPEHLAIQIDCLPTVPCPTDAKLEVSSVVITK